MLALPGMMPQLCSIGMLHAARHHMEVDIAQLAPTESMRSCAHRVQALTCCCHHHTRNKLCHVQGDTHSCPSLGPLGWHPHIWPAQIQAG